MPDVRVEIEVWCSCGEGLCGQSRGRAGGIVVEPCKRCQQEAHDEGYEEAMRAQEV